MSDVNDTCEYVLDPDDPETWGGEDGDACHVGEESLNDDGVWTCPHDAVEGENLCIFHFPPQNKEDGHVSNAFLDAVEQFDASSNGQSTRSNEFIGARFGSLSLTDADTIGSGSFRIDLSHAEFDGVVDWSGTTFESDVSIAGAKFRNGLDLGGVTFDGSVFAPSVTIRAGEGLGNQLRLGARYTDEANFAHATFAGNSFDIDFVGTVHDRMTFRGATFDGDVDFSLANFTADSDVNFAGAEFDGDVEFGQRMGIGTDLDGRVTFENAVVSGETIFRGATFRQTPDFQSVSFDDADFRHSTFEAGALFGGSTFDGVADFGSATFRGKTEFTSRRITNSKIEFNRDVVFENATFGGEVDFTGAEFNDGVNFGRSTFDDEASLEKVDLTGAIFTDGDLCNVDLESAILSRATLSGADLRGAKLSGAVLSDARIDGETRFLGHPSEDDDTSPYTLTAIRSRPRCVYDPDYGEDGEHAEHEAKRVYKALEELAGRTGRPRLQRQCFVRRQDLQREEYWRDARQADTVEATFVAGFQWLRAKTSELVMLYGESPWRILATSAVIMVLFGLFYSIAGGITVTTRSASHAFDVPRSISVPIPAPVETLLMNLYFSVVTFTTLGYGDIQPSNAATQALAGFESLLGSALIALLVFVLGRRATR